ncbi:DNA translocase FtsK [Natronospirillum operosum]|uniref:DNA translocase FtsK n=1 Tax=Natronospirillum operosum TaxID=2759953 RepID=A0A4Z0WBE2_9GAMM|nr:FtsK/SpoIIIE domain-containing protein [Natronospirillum operosum]TGG91790.1 DNA translocase FtsK [Natronospirillum operosum]
MTRNELIAAVALDFVKAHLSQEAGGSMRFCMLGLDPSLVRSIAKAVLGDAETSSTVLVKISSLFDSEDDLPPNVKSDQSITHWRHCRLPDDRRAVLFAASQQELQRNDKSVEKVTKIEADTLRDRYDAWVDLVGLTSVHLDVVKREHLLTALKAANQSHAARTIETFADFVISIAEGIISTGLPIQKAIDNALPTLRLPRFSGHFDRIPEKKRKHVGEWTKTFKGLHNKVRPLLVQETEKGEPIPRERLRTNFEEIYDRLDASEKHAIEAFLDADLRIDDWSEAQKGLVNLDWRSISDLFEGVTKSSSQPLGDETIKFFDDEYDDLLEDEERELLAGTFPKEPSSDLQEFFETHREHLARDKKISSKWERYVYRNPQSYQDFLIGLLETLDSLRRRVTDDELKEKKLTVRIPNSREKSFWRGKNPKIARYFAFRYRGLQEALGPNVELDFGKLMEFYFPLTDAGLAKTTSSSKEARSIKFEAVLDPEGAKAKLVFHWEMPVDAIATALPDDLLSISNEGEEFALLPTADIARQSVSAKGSIQRIALNDLNTIRDVINTNSGKLVAPNSTSGDKSVDFLSELKSLSSVLGTAGVNTLGDRFASFRSAYSAAIRDWATIGGSGIGSATFVKQVEAYEELLASLLCHASNDRAREGLWQNILRLGVANVGSGSPAAIITPWHPMRLAEISIKTKQAAKVINDVLVAQEDDIFRADLLFSQIQFELHANYYPEVCIGFDRDQPTLLSAADTSYDYTLAEPPFRKSRQGREDALDVDPGVAAKAFSNVGEQYLKLLPHGRSNFSVVLYNAESKALPSALASELSSKVEQENELQCDLLLTHSEPKRIRRIYEQQNVTVNDESGSVMASEAARNFLSRLRVGFLDAAKIPDDDTNRAADLVALQDVVARNAQLVWKKAPGNRNPEIMTHVPARWSRRRPIGLADTSTSVYLACPVQPKSGQNYLNLINGYLSGDNALPGDVIPAREVNFRDGDIGNIFTQTHKIGEWVVNFDELVDRRLLNNNGVSVIRHIRDRQVDRNIVVSTTSKPRLLRVLLKERLERLDPAIVGADESVVDQLIDQANTLSGQVVMRAARYGHYANELLGIVLSMEEIQSGLENSKLPIGWYFLDDFASWFGQREEQIADIMAIAPRIVEGKPVLKVAISEAKFVTSTGYRAQAKKSAKQLEETVARLGRALDSNHKRIDRDIWLNRIGDFMIEGMEPFDAALMNGWDLHKWSDEVRQDNIPIQLAGFSHVFVHDSDEYVDGGDATPIKGMPHCVQQVFDKPSVAKLFRSFAEKNKASGEPQKDRNDTWSKALLSTGEESSSLQTQTNAESSVQSETPTSERNELADTNEPLRQEEEAEAVSPASVEKSALSLNEAMEKSADSAIPGELLKMWPSQQLAEWVNQGSVSEEEDEDTRVWLDSTVKALQKALRGYDMTAELLGARLTPNAALVRFRGSDDLTIPKVEKKRQELLTSHAVDVINVMAAPMEVVIMVKRPNRAILRLQDLWRRRQLPSTAPESNTSLLLGAKESDGEILYLNVGSEFGGHQAHGPHTLIAGETGSGKGVLVQSLLLDICATNSPEKARIRMIDPKAGIDFPWLRNMPHLDGDLITEKDAAIQALEELVAEMERRNRLLAEAGVTKLDNYNRKVPASEQLPRIWLFHDELADWMMINDYRDAVDLNASRLGVKARAAGINLVLITQRPDKDALPMQLRANLTNRLVLKVADKKNSMLVLDEPGAERLLGRGHLAAKLSGEGSVILAQVPFASEEEIARLAKIIGEIW